MSKYHILIVFLLFLGVFCLRQVHWNTDFFLSETAAPSGEINSVIQDSGEIKIWFCPQEDCESALVSFLDSAQNSIHCAFFEIDLEAIKNKLLEKAESLEVKVVTDNDYLQQFNHPFLKADRGGLMHNKFCIIDGKKVSTGSMNPTVNCAHKNNNNFLIINSTVLAQNYEDEFQELWNGTFKKGDLVRNPRLSLENTILEVYFCPEDHCAQEVKEALKKAEHSIYFMTFSFTHEGIGNILLLKNLENLTIQGVMEARQITKDSQFQRLKYQGIKVLPDQNKNNLHHKVFIIDEKTVLTGSFNPTANGDKGNDENLLIIHDERIAQDFLKEFWKVWEEAEIGSDEK